MNRNKIKALFPIWKRKNFDLSYYFKNIFDISLELLRENTKKLIRDTLDAGTYKCLFMPVGFKIENIALVASFIKPTHLTLGFSEITKRFHNKHFELVKEVITTHCPGINIDMETYNSKTDSEIKKGITKWVYEAKSTLQYPHKHLAIDLTGGTKPMSIGTQGAALYYRDIDAYYLSVDYDEETHHPVPGTEQLLKLVKAGFEVDPSFVFVLIPNDRGFPEIYDLIQESVKNAGLTCDRVEHQAFTGEIMAKIREGIYKAGIIIADTTNNNPNVLYEIGIAHEAGKEVILLTRDINNTPFDIKVMKHIIYTPGDQKYFKDELGKMLEAYKNPLQ